MSEKFFAGRGIVACVVNKKKIYSGRIRKNKNGTTYVILRRKRINLPRLYPVDSIVDITKIVKSQLKNKK